MRDTSGPAYPCDAYASEPGFRTGLTKRELFAAMAMQGQLANWAILERFGLHQADLAVASVAFADSLIAELAA